MSLSPVDAMQPLPKPTGSAAQEDPYDFESASWYNALMASPVTRTLRNSDFTAGTFRITTPGRYQLAEVTFLNAARHTYLKLVSL